MALIKCGECGKDISSEAKACPNCGKPQTGAQPVLPPKPKAPANDSNFIKNLLIIGAVFGVVLAATYKTGGGSQSVQAAPKPPAADYAKIDASVKELLQAGVITKIDPSMNEVFVNPIAWYRSTFEQKKTMGYVFGHYCGRGSDTAWVNIRHANSGKVIAKWSKVWGFENKE